MERSKRSLFILLLILAAVIVTLYFFIDAILESAAQKVIDFISTNLARDGVELSDQTFEKVAISFPPALSIKDFSTRVIMLQKTDFQIEKNFFFTVQSAGISLYNIMKGEFVFKIENAVVARKPEFLSKNSSDEGLSAKDKFVIKYLALPFKINIFDRKDAYTKITHLVKGLAKFAKYGVTDLNMDMVGFNQFVVGDKLVRGKIILKPYGKDKKLVMDVKDFQVISEVLGEKLTRYEFFVYCDNPLRMPRMLRIRNQASDAAYEEYKKDPNVPQEAYKHVLWAYLLTVAYDSNFSKETTDSHEFDPAGRAELDVRVYLASERNVKPTVFPDGSKKTEAEIRMDLVNNAIGRKYARRGYPEYSLLEHTMRDPDVIRNAFDDVRNQKKSAAGAVEGQ